MRQLHVDPYNKIVIKAVAQHGHTHIFQIHLDEENPQDLFAYMLENGHVWFR